MNLIATLPPEILAHIILHLKYYPADLRSLSLVSRAFKPESHRILFRTLSLALEESTLSRFTPSEITAFLLYISQGSHPISTYTHNVHLSLSYDVDVQIPDFNVHFASALCGMRNLQSLRMETHNYGGRMPLEEVANRIPFQLHTLETDLSSFDGFIEFVRSQKALISLIWLFKNPPTPTEAYRFTPQDLPCLTKLKLEHISWATTFLPQCSITHLGLASATHIDSLGFLSSVRALAIDDIAGVVRSFDQLATQFPNVEFLDINCRALSIEEPFNFDGKTAFPHLIKLKVWERWFDSDNWFNIAHKLFSNFSMTCFDIVCRTTRAEGVRILRVRKVLAEGHNEDVVREIIRGSSFDYYDQEWARWSGTLTYETEN